jgi:hypothetical protein
MAAISHMKEMEKDMPDGLGVKLDDCLKAIEEALGGSSSGDGKSASDSMDEAKQKTRDRLKSEPTDATGADDKSSSQYKS